MDLWFSERETENIKVQWKLARTLASHQSQYQKIDIVEFVEFGRGLILDGVIQTTLSDEFIYHEMLAHVPLNTHPNPKTVLVVGGGDGGTVREVLKHNIDSVDLVEIDGDVVRLCREFLPELAGGLDDPRVRVHIGDGIEYVRKREAAYDCVLVDSSDPVGPAVGLFAREFYSDIFRALKPGGLMAAQTESPLFNQDLIRQVTKGLRQIFQDVRFYWANVPTYSIGPWSFALAGQNIKGVNMSVTSGCRYYNDAIHQGAFMLPAYFQDLLK
ncbi:MAG: polyamine aminopropyltransferase [Firmicutes bacterium]|nr:polyamine aminopropyltransferase [Bacillota bacterium]